ncbi:hypothetical protein PHMEG_00028062, partial [Phytophthora megakarya]
SSSQLRDLPWRVKELVFVVLFREQVSSNAVAEELQNKSRDRKMERKAEKLLGELDRSVVRKKEESYRADFMQVVAAELARLGAPALITWQKLVFDKECCAQAFRLLLTRIKSSRRSAASGVSTNSSSLLAARYAGSLQKSRQSNDNNRLDDEQRETNDEQAYNQTDEQTRFPPLKITEDTLRHRTVTRTKGSSFTSQSRYDSKTSTLDWNFDTTIDTSSEEDRNGDVSVRGSTEKIGQVSRTTSHQTGAGITIERTLTGKQSSHFASKFKKNQLHALQDANATLTAENAKLRDEIKQLDELNAVLQSDLSNNSLLNDHGESVQFIQRRMKLLQAQNLQLQRQVSLLQDSVQANENAEINLIAALNHWRTVIEAGCEEAKAAGANQHTETPNEPEAGQSVKWMMAVPDQLLHELKRVEGQIRGAANAANACFETKLRVSKLSSSFILDNDNSVRISEIYGREPSCLAHLRVDRIKQLEDALGSVLAELDQLSAEALHHFPPKVSTTNLVYWNASEMCRRVRELLLEVGAFGVVVPTPFVSTYKHTAATASDENSTACDLIKALSSRTGVARGPGGAKEREKQAKVMLKQLNARYAAMENDLVACRREAEYWRSAWNTQDDILCRLTKRVRLLGQKKVEWCQHYLLAPMENLVGVFASFQQVYDENTTRQNPYLPLLVETLSMEHPMLKDALTQWQDYSSSIELKLDELVADYESNRFVLGSTFTKQKSPLPTPIPELGDDRLPSVSEQVPVC